MDESYALVLLKREYQEIATDMQLQGPGPGVFFDPRQVKLSSLEDAINQLRGISENRGK